MKKVWFITGSARGLGRSITAAVLAKGDLLAATARNTDQLKEFTEKYPDQILPITLDVTDTAQVAAAVAKTMEHFGRIDVLVNNAGFGITGAAEAFTDEQVRSQLEANLYGPIDITRAVIPHMRRQGSGRIMQVSSIGGRVGTPGVTIYQAAKFGLSGFSEALSKELTPLGIYVTAIEPGGFRTDWAGSSMDFAPHVDGYESTIGWIKELFRNGNFVPTGDPDKAAKVMVELADHPAPPVHLLLGSDAIGLVKQGEQARLDTIDEWQHVSLSTDHDDSPNFFETETGRKYAQLKK